MKAWTAVRAISGILLCVVGFALARAPRFREATVVVDAGGCRMVTDILDDGEDTTQGSVMLLHGLAANKKIMAYVARGFALQHLRVFVPDLPGHGRTPGPFSFTRAEACSDSFVRQLIARGAIDPASTILAGHSMGGAIAIRVGARAKVAGIIAIAPAPMVSTYGVSTSMLIFTDPPATPANTLVLSGSAEPRGVRDSARSLIEGAAAASGKYIVIPHSTHASLLSDANAVRASQDWAAQVLKLVSGAKVPSRMPLAGAAAGLFGLLLLAGPFLREMLGENSLLKRGATATKTWSYPEEPSSPVIATSAGRSLMEIAGLSIAVVLLLKAFPAAWNPFSVFRIFEGDYLAGFLFILGVGLLLIHRKSLGSLRQSKSGPLVAAALAAVVLSLLIYGWLDLTISEAWITSARWLRFPALFAAVLPFHSAEELFVGPWRVRAGKTRLFLALAFRLVIWGALLVGILLHNGEILLVLMAPYIALFCLFQRTGMDVVRKSTGSPLAAALFGAILLAGFSVVVFPIT
jgi:pimeloyl-ACP methyl ester carboxylesterase